MLLSTTSIKAWAYDYQLAVENEEGVMIYYNYVDGGLEVTYKEITSSPRVHYLGSVVIPDSVEVTPSVKRAVVSIGPSAFESCQALTSVTIPSTVKIIKTFAFTGCDHLKDMTLLGKITLSGQDPIRGCDRLKNVYISNLEDWLNITCDKDYTDSGNKNSLFYNTKDIYLNDEKIVDLIIPKNVTTIRDFAFYGCQSIKSLTIPDGVTSIGQQAFYGCNSIESLTLPSSITYIGANAFRTSLLKSVVVQSETPSSWGGSSVFNGKTINHGVLYVPTNAWEAYAFGDWWYTFINIRELTTTTEELSAKKVYTLMNTSNFGYTVYDPVNDELRTDVPVNGIDENNPYHNWQTLERNGQTFLYNIGAKKFVVPSEGGESLALTDKVSSITMENSEHGVLLAGKRNTHWGFVDNENLAANKDLEDMVTTIGGISCKETEESPVQALRYNINGQQITTPQKGVNIIRYSDGKTRKVLVK